MSHFAEIDNDNIVQRVLVVDQDFIDSGKLGDPNNWVQTSYNTRGGVHYAPNSNTPDGGIAPLDEWYMMGVMGKSGPNDPVTPEEARIEGIGRSDLYVWGEP